MTAPLIDWPLEGTHRIEASAGTGKTFALALLHTRLVVERELPVRQILAVTYTIAATQELRERLRAQLVRAAVARGARSPTRCARRPRSERRRDRDHGRRARAPARSAGEPRRARRAPAPRGRRDRSRADPHDPRVLSAHACRSRARERRAARSDRVRDQRARAARRDRATTSGAASRASADTAARLELLWKSPDALARDLRQLLTPKSAAGAGRGRPGSARAHRHRRPRRCATRAGAICPNAAASSRPRAAAGVLSRKLAAAMRDVAAAGTSLAAFADGAVLDDRDHERLDALTRRASRSGQQEVSAHQPPPSVALSAAVDAFFDVRGAGLRAQAEARANLLHDGARRRARAHGRDQARTWPHRLRRSRRARARGARVGGRRASRRRASRRMSGRARRRVPGYRREAMGCVPAHLCRARRDGAARVVPDRRSEAGDLSLPRRRRAHVSRRRRVRRIDRNARSKFPFASAHDRSGRRGVRRRRRASVRGRRDAVSARRAGRQGRRRRSRRRPPRRAGAASAQSFAARRRTGSAADENGCRARARRAGGRERDRRAAQRRAAYGCAATARTRRIEPGDIAVLVNRNDEAARMQRELAPARHRERDCAARKRVRHERSGRDPAICSKRCSRSVTKAACARRSRAC